MGRALSQSHDYALKHPLLFGIGGASASLDPDQLLKLYEIENNQVHASLDHILTIRGMMALAFAALLSATLIYREKVIALGGFIFIGAWWWEYIYARYLDVYTNRANDLRAWVGQMTQSTPSLATTYAKPAYDHRLIARLFRRWGDVFGVQPFTEGWRTFFIAFFDPPRAAAYLAMCLAPLAVAALLGFPWISP